MTEQTDVTNETATTGRRSLMRALGVAGTVGLAGCMTGASSDEGPYDGWLSDAIGYDGTTADRTGQSEVTVDVGADGGFAFSPAAVRVTAGTTVVWEWVGGGSRHNVVAKDGSYESPYYRAGGKTFEHTFSESGVSKYYCLPHRGMGMKGVVEVVTEQVASQQSQT